MDVCEFGHSNSRLAHQADRSRLNESRKIRFSKDETASPRYFASISVYVSLDSSYETVTREDSENLQEIGSGKAFRGFSSSEARL